MQVLLQPAAPAADAHVPAPPQVSSYGGFLTYQSKSFGVPSEGMTLMDRRPDVVLTVGDVA